MYTISLNLTQTNLTNFPAQYEVGRQWTLIDNYCITLKIEKKNSKIQLNLKYIIAL